ncbi:hypothetical protein EVAR_59314_1 [Eumeta japonica]|uniref:Uncharacterized protein n=1 Tax=Eumeta variegata TaxID=151549 RepID=A0A4C1YBT7_EUMVA|nr:hypothetical protein EVAR_59314_1 [Eumeta japonica]
MGFYEERCPGPAAGPARAPPLITELSEWAICLLNVHLSFGHNALGIPQVNIRLCAREKEQRRAPRRQARHLTLQGAPDETPSKHTHSYAHTN